jgi:hypothetical protein
LGGNTTATIPVLDLNSAVHSMTARVSGAP